MVDKSRSAEISRLADLLQSHPDSRLFVPLAEAYLLSDMLEEAIQVLSHGLKTHANFVAARVMLGKIYLKKTQLSGAKEQFNQVIAIAPNNIPSLKGLAEIYKQEGLFAEAKTAYRSILKIDPGDKEATASIEGLEDKSGPVVEQETQETKESSDLENDKTGTDTIAEDLAQDGEVRLQQEEALDNSDETPIVLKPHENKTMAALYMTQSHYQEAADVYERLLKQNPMDHESQQKLKEALSHLKNDANAPISKVEKIERLQLWLTAIQGEKNR